MTGATNTRRERIVPPELWLAFTQKRTIALFVLAGLLVGLLYALLRTDQYTSHATLMFDNRRILFGADGSVMTESALTDGLIDSQIEILKSDDLALRVIDGLALHDDPEFADQETPTVRRLLGALGLVDADFDPAGRRTAALKTFQDDLTVQRLGLTYLAQLKFTSTDPAKSASVLKDLIASYLALRTDQNARNAAMTTGWLRDRASEIGPTATVVTAPLPPSSPSGLGGVPILVAFGTLGLIAGLGVALWKGLTDRQSRTAGDLEEATGLRCFGALPWCALGGGPTARLTAAVDDPSTVFSRTLQRAASDLLGRSGRPEAVVIAVAAVDPGDGATTAAANLAALLGEASEGRVLLIDAGLPDATLSRQLGSGGGRGLLGCLASGGRPCDVVTKIGPKVDLLPLGAVEGVPPTATALWSAPMADLIARFRESYAHILIDLPAASARGDLWQTAHLADAVVLVVTALSSASAEFDAIVSDAASRPCIRGLLLAEHGAPPSILNRLPFRRRGTKPAGPASSGGESVRTPGAGRALPPSPGARQKGVKAAVSGALLACLLLFPAGASRADDYVVEPSDTIEIRVFEYPELGGTFAVDGDGTIAVAALGQVDVAGRRPRDLVPVITDLLRTRQKVSGPLSVVVRVAQYRPVYVVGAVERPGAYPFQPRLSVVQAITLAGGPYRSDAGQLRGMIDDLGGIEKLRRDRARTIVRIARLEAERTGLPEVDYPLDRLSLVDSDELATLIADENGIFASRKAVLDEKIAAFTRLGELYSGEIDTLQKQMVLKTSQIESYDTELSRVTRSTNPSSRELELRRSKADAEFDKLGLIALIQRAQQMASQAEQDVASARGARTAEIATALAEARASLRRTETDLATTRDQLRESGVVSTAESLPDEAPSPALAYSVLRMVHGAPVEIAMDEATLLEPGDVLRVSRHGPVESGSP